MSDPTNQYPSIDQSPTVRPPTVKHSRVRTASRRTARPSR